MLEVIIISFISITSPTPHVQEGNESLKYKLYCGLVEVEVEVEVENLVTN